MNLQPIGLTSRIMKAQRDVIEAATQIERVSAKTAINWFAAIHRSYFADFAFYTEAFRPDRIPVWHWDYTKPKTKKRKRAWITWRARRSEKWLRLWGDSKWVKAKKVYSFAENIPLQPEREAAQLFSRIIATLPDAAVKWAFEHAAEKLRLATANGQKWEIGLGVPLYCIIILMHEARVRYWQARIPPSKRWQPSKAVQAMFSWQPAN